jgi:undecaprenyl diphosphate synthase
MNNGLHVAIIMDGNGRWAEARGWPRLAGHRAGAETVRRVVEAAPGLGVRALTLYAFSSDNWKRPSEEVTGLFRLFSRYLRHEAKKLADSSVRFQAIGRRDRLPAGLRELMERVEEETSGGKRLELRVAIDYSARGQMLAALSEGRTPPVAAPDVDLLIRTGGEKRLSDFLLWESAYAELHFTPVQWPDFTAADLERALAEFRTRDRRFGAIPMTAQATA